MCSAGTPIFGSRAWAPEHQRRLAVLVIRATKGSPVARPWAHSLVPVLKTCPSPRCRAAHPRPDGGEGSSVPRWTATAVEYRGLVTAMDTSCDAVRLQRAVLRSKTGDERASMAVEMSELVRPITIDGIRRRSPHIGSDELALQLIERLHGAALARAVARARGVPVVGGH